MVIAPLLGPILAFALGSALGDFALMTKATRTALSGLFLGMAISVVIGLVFDVNLGSAELTNRTIVGLDSTALALASGAAAALSIVAGLPSTLVGVMVAVALLPPAASTGLFAGSGEWALAGRAGLLLMINIVSVNLAALLVFFFKGVRPRTWLERRSAKRSVYLIGTYWADSNGRHNTLKLDVAMSNGKRRSARPGRAPLHSPGRPPAAGRDE